jgi:ribosome-associated protein
LTSDALRDLVVAALDDLKGEDIVALDVRRMTAIADHMVIVTGRSARHVGALAEKVREAAKEAGVPPLGVEGEDGCQWVLVDLGVVIVHAMQAEIREFYQLERLWSTEGRKKLARPEEGTECR